MTTEYAPAGSVSASTSTRTLRRGRGGMAATAVGGGAPKRAVDAEVSSGEMSAARTLLATPVAVPFPLLERRRPKLLLRARCC